MINVDPVRHQFLPMRETALFDDEKQGRRAVPFRQDKIFVEILLARGIGPVEKLRRLVHEKEPPVQIKGETARALRRPLEKDVAVFSQARIKKIRSVGEG